MLSTDPCSEPFAVRQTVGRSLWRALMPAALSIACVALPCVTPNALADDFSPGTDDEYDTRARPGAAPTPYTPPTRPRPATPGKPFTGFSTFPTAPAGTPRHTRPLPQIPPERGLDEGLPALPGTMPDPLAPPRALPPQVPNTDADIYTAPPRFAPVDPNVNPYRGHPSTTRRYPPGTFPPETTTAPPYNQPPVVVSPPIVPVPRGTSSQGFRETRPNTVVSPPITYAPRMPPRTPPPQSQEQLVDEFGRPINTPVPPLPESLPPPLGPVGRSISVVRRNTSRLTIQGAYTLPADDPEDIIALPGPLAGFHWDELNYDGRFGGRAGLMLRTGADSRLHAQFTYLGGFDDITRQRATFTYSDTPGGVVTTTPLNAARVARDLDVFHGEISYRPQLSSSRTADVDGIIGVRGIVVNEDGSVIDFAAPINPAFVGAPRLDVEASTTFIGAQGGIGAEFKLTDDVNLEISAKAFGGIAWRDLESEQRAIVASGTTKSDDDDSIFAWGGEIEMGIRAPISDSVGVSVGYSLLYLDGIVDVNSALDWSNTASGAVPATLKDESILTHTFFVGLSFDF